MQVYKSNSIIKLTTNKQPLPNLYSSLHTTVSEFLLPELLNLSPLSSAISVSSNISLYFKMIIYCFFFISQLWAHLTCNYGGYELASYILTHPCPSLSFTPFFFFFVFLTIFGQMNICIYMYYFNVNIAHKIFLSLYKVIFP